MVNRNLIYDIGMHKGCDATFYLLKGFNVVAVEANEELVRTVSPYLENMVLEGRLRIVSKAITEDGGAATLRIFDKKDDWGTIVDGWNESMEQSDKEVVVGGTTIDRLIKQYGMPYYMKIDIEGSDIICLKQLFHHNERPTYISVELLTPNNLGREAECMDILCHLKALGYNRFYVADQSKNESIICPYPSIEGKFKSYKFDGHCSGLFGEELQGEWYDIDTISKMYLEYFKGYKKQGKLMRKINSIWRRLFPSPTPFHREGWFDVHAKRV